MGEQPIIITEAEIRRGIEQYESVMRELCALLAAAPRWQRLSAVGAAFGRWTDRHETPWQVAFIEAKHFILKHGYPPWELDECSK